MLLNDDIPDVNVINIPQKLPIMKEPTRRHNIFQIQIQNYKAYKGRHIISLQKQYELQTLQQRRGNTEHLEVCDSTQKLKVNLDINKEK